MKVVLFQENRDQKSSIQDFLQALFTNRLEYFASDLLEAGISPAEINQALKRAILAAKSAGLQIREHFHHQYSDYGGTTISDCRLSRLGYGLLLMNANIASPAVANWQVHLLKHFFST